MLAGDIDDERMVGALHDVIEDNRGVWTAARLREEGFSARVVDAIVCVTRLPGESYGDFIRRAATDPIGQEGQAPRYRRQQRSVANSKSDAAGSRSCCEVPSRKHSARG